MPTTTVIEQIDTELARLNATEIIVADQADTDTSSVKVKVDHKTCLLEAEGFLRMLQGMPSGIGADQVKSAIQKNAREGAEWATR